MVLRVQSDIPAEIEEIAERTIGCLITVHRILGPGFRELIYKRAACHEFAIHAISYEYEKSIRVPYRDILIPGHKIDMLIENVLILECKVLPAIKEVHRMQVRSYLKATGLRLGYVVNFNAPILKGSIKRVVL